MGAALATGPMPSIRFSLVLIGLNLTLFSSQLLAQEQEIPWEITEAAIEDGGQAKRKLLLEWSAPSPTEASELAEKPSSDEVRNDDTESTAAPPLIQRRGPSTTSCPTPWRIALTFDDGPYGSHTSTILDILLDKQVRATFFLVGRQIKAHPQIVRRIYNEGHEIALHSYSHPDLSKLSPADQSWEMDRSRHSLDMTLPGFLPAWWRAPYGSVTGASVAFGRQNGMEHQGWTIDTLDWRKPSINQFLNTVLARARDGDVVLMHDHSPTTRQALATLIDELRYGGFEMRTLSDLRAPACLELANSMQEGYRQDDSTEG